jgi:hypothetical protein
MSKININAYGELQNDPDLSYELLYDPASNNTFKKKRDTWKTKKIRISTAEIASVGSSPITLLSAPGINKYYEWQADIEYIGGGTAFTMSTPFTIQQGTSNKFPIGLLAATTGTYVTFARPGFNGTGASIGYAFVPNNALLLSTLSGTDPTGGGNGYLIIKLKYKIKTLG